MITHPAPLSPVVAGGGNFVQLATAMIAVDRLAALWNALQIHIKRHSRSGPETRHNLLPLGSVWLYATPWISFVHDKMGHLVGYGIAQIFLEILGEYPRVVANKATFSDGLEHARRTARQIKKNLYTIKAATKNLFRLTDEVLSHLFNLALLCVPNWLDHDKNSPVP